MSMLLCTQTDVVFRTLGEKEGIDVFAKAGYDALDYSMFSMTDDNAPLNHCDPAEHAKKLRSMVEDAGLTFRQAHAPFPGVRMGDDAYTQKMAPRMKNAIAIAGMLGAQTIVVHPFASGEEASVQMERNLTYYRSLEATAREYGIRIAVENMWGYDKRRGYIVPNVCSVPAELAAYVDALPADVFTVCLDLGHCGLVGEDAAGFIRALGGKRLTALHIHDNNFRGDTHTIPYSCGCGMDWDAILAALAAIGYSGNFTYEADNFLARFPKDFLPTAVQFMASLGRYMMERLEAEKAAISR